MSYNCDTAIYISGKLFITKDNALKAIDLFEDGMPGGGFLVDILKGCGQGLGIPDLEHEIGRPGFTGEFSGSCYEKTKEALALCHGEADILMVWEGGDDYSGLRVKDGKVTEHKVVFSLGDEK